MNTPNTTSRTSDRLMIALAALLAANLAVTLVNTFNPAAANAQVSSVARTGSPEPVGLTNSGANPPTPPSTVEGLRRLSDQLEVITAALANIERKLDGELKVRVTNPPAAPSK